MVTIKTPEEIKVMRRANLIVADILEEIGQMIKPGISTGELNEKAEDLVKKKGAEPAFKGYAGFPSALCASINEEVVHGIPSFKRILKEGDIIGLDFGVCLNGYYGDAALTVGVGEVSNEADKLMRVTKESLSLAIDKALVDNRLSDISHAIQSHVEKEGFSVVRSFVGHGIGKSLHESPQVPNFGRPNKGIELKAGMVLAIEPMINAGHSDVVVQKDGWTAVTVDKSLSAHYEHSVAITDDGPFILSRKQTTNVSI